MLLASLIEKLLMKNVRYNQHDFLKIIFIIIFKNWQIFSMRHWLSLIIFLKQEIFKRQ